MSVTDGFVEELGELRLRFDYGTLIIFPKQIINNTIGLENILLEAAETKVYLVIEPQTVIVRTVSGTVFRASLPVGALLVPRSRSNLDSSRFLTLNRPEWVSACRLGSKEKEIIKIKKKDNFIEGRVEPREPRDPVSLFISGYPVRVPVCWDCNAIPAATVRGHLYYGYEGDTLVHVEGEGPAEDLLNYILPLYSRCEGQ